MSLRGCFPFSSAEPGYFQLLCEKRAADVCSHIIGIANDLHSHCLTPNIQGSLAITPGALELFAQNYSLGNFLHRLPSLPAVLLQRQVSFCFVNLKVSLQNSLRAFDHFAALEFDGESRIFSLEARHLHFRSN